MKLFYSLLQKILKMLVNLIFIIQIALTITVFVVTVYWFMSMLEMGFFDFASPVADLITSFIKIFYSGTVSLGAEEFDPAILIFDIITFMLIFAGNKLKEFIYTLMKLLDIAKANCYLREEAKVNSNLKSEYEAELAKMSHSAILAEFAIRLDSADMYYVDDLTEKIKEKEEYVLDSLYNNLKPLTIVEKTGNRILVMVDEFKKTDTILNRIYEVFDRLSAELKAGNWGIDMYVSLEAFDDKAVLDNIYSLLSGLLDLRLRNEALCYGNFALRYGLEPVRSYNAVLKGKYASEVWTLVRGNKL